MVSHSSAREARRLSNCQPCVVKCRKKTEFCPSQIYLLMQSVSFSQGALDHRLQAWIGLTRQVVVKHSFCGRGVNDA
jgi:hypothetical protein